MKRILHTFSFFLRVFLQGMVDEPWLQLQQFTF
ncbi:hypothetical protein P746_00773 [Enterococcus faecalis CBRD01]|nr:hypothetical protein P746_00773 [Enterococcus faecalis CBRD01]